MEEKLSSSGTEPKEAASAKRPAARLAGILKALDRVFYKVDRWILPLAILIAWHIATAVTQSVSPMLIPPLKAVFDNVAKQLESGLLLSDLKISGLRVIKGYFAGAALGVALGVGMGVSKHVNRMFSAVLSGIRQIPPLAWMPLMILWFGIKDTSKIVLVGKAAFFPILLNTIEGVASTSKGHLELARLYKVSKKDLLTKIYMPTAVPHIFVGLRLGAGMAWMSVVAAEMMAASSGIGYRISNAQQLMQSDLLITDMLAIGFIGGLADFLLRKAINRATKWKAA